MFTGLTTETPVDESAVGPTLECLLGRQFNRLKYGDRYWYQGNATNFNAGKYITFYFTKYDSFVSKCNEKYIIVKKGYKY